MSIPPSTEQEPNVPEPTNLRFLRRLVTMLTATMIFGIIGIFALLVMRLNGETQAVTLDVDLPAGVAVHSLSITDDHKLAVGDDGILYVFDRNDTLLTTTPLR